MGRRKINFERFVACFPAGTIERIVAWLNPNETRAEFIRQAVETEIGIRRADKRLMRKPTSDVPTASEGLSPAGDKGEAA